MESIIFKQLVLVLPELMLAFLAMGSQISAVFFRRKSAKVIGVNAIVLAIAIIFLVFRISKNQLSGFHESFIVDRVTGLFKAIVLVFTIVSLIIYQDFCKIAEEELRIEYFTLMLMSTIGVFLSMSSRNFLLLFCGLELQALSSYALAGFNISSIKSSEGAMKYFILGALLSCISLFGMSLLYGFVGSLEFIDVLKALNNPHHLNLGVIIGVVLMLSGLFFKLSAAPLHMWTPDVYEGAPLPVVNYFATALKIGTFAILLNVLTFVVGSYRPISVDLIKIIAIFSMIIGVLGAIRQNSLKRLMAYSTVLNMGYVLMAVSLNSAEGRFAATIYLLIYIIGVVAFFACITALLGKKSDDATFEDIKGVATHRKAIAGVLSLIMFSMVGLPPLAGFFGKYYVFYQAIVMHEFTLAFIAITTSVIAAFYYLKIIKYMYFEEQVESFVRIQTSSGLLFVTSCSVGFTMLFSFIPISYFKLFAG